VAEWELRHEKGSFPERTFFRWSSRQGKRILVNTPLKVVNTKKKIIDLRGGYRNSEESIKEFKLSG